MTSEATQVCVCGHNHIINSRNPPGPQRFDQCCVIGCLCRTFRPCLPWPDSEGWWWCGVAGFRNGRLYESRLMTGNVWMIAADGNWRSRNEYGPTRFVKLLEQSPFTDHTKGSSF